MTAIRRARREPTAVTPITSSRVACGLLPRPRHQPAAPRRAPRAGQPCAPARALPPRARRPSAPSLPARPGVPRISRSCAAPAPRRLPWARSAPSARGGSSSLDAADLGGDDGNARGHRLDDRRAGSPRSRSPAGAHSASASSSGTSSRLPRKRTAPPSPSSAARRSASARSGPSPTRSSVALWNLLSGTEANARNARSGRFGGASRPTSRTRPRTGPEPAPKRSSETPFGITRYCSRSPDPLGEPRVALGPRRAPRSPGTSAPPAARAAGRAAPPRPRPPRTTSRAG